MSSNRGGGDVRVGYEIRSNFECVEDHVGPSFSASSEALTINPVDLGWIGADEMVASAVEASLVDAAGNAMALAPTGVRTFWGRSRFDVSAALAFATTYTLIASGLDFAGNAGTSSTPFTTDPDLGLFAQDGFEGPINAARTGVTIIDTTKLPAPAGLWGMPAPTAQKALAFTKVWSGEAYARFTARLQAPASATAVKVTYVRARGKVPDGTEPAVTYPESHIVWTVGIPNTTAIAAYDKDKPPVTVTPRAWAIDPAAQGATGWYSEPQTLSFPLPAPAVGGEVIFDVVSDQFTSSGDGAFILDDLRVE